MPQLNNNYDKKHLRNIAVICARIDRIFDKAAEEAALIGATIKDDLGDRIFSFRDYPQTRKQVEALTEELHASLETTIVNGIDGAWALSNGKNDDLVRRVFGRKADDLPEAQRRRYFNNNAQALEAFLARKTQGLGLSDRVWRYTDAFKNEIELGLDLGIRSGKSAAAMTRDLRQYLQHPDKLFRRVRDEHGLLKLSQAAKDFHPGRGVYRSSYMNARRLAATETNIAYRTADHLRWQKMDFVVGIEIVLSNNHTIRLQPGEKTSDLPGQMRADGTPKANAVRTLTDICDTLAGRYPKDFKFTGWHPHCRCHAVTILKTEEEMARDTKRILDGRQPSADSANAVTDTPEAFKNWVENNRDRIANGHSLPYFIRDNAKYTGITTKQTRTAKTPLDIAAERHANRTIAQVRDIQFRWSRRLANRINFDAINVSDRGRYGRLIVMTSIAEKKEFNAAEFNLLYGIVVRHAQRTAKQIQEIRQRWDKRIIERAGETKQVAALRKVLEQQKITDISDVKRVMHAFYGQFPQEFNNVRVDFVSFDRPPLNGSFTMGYSIHDIEIAFNSNKGWEKKSPLDTIVKALDKIRTRDKMSLAQLRGVATIVHELLHQKASKYVRLKAHYSGDYKRTAMETMNELASRATVARFIRRLGGSTDGASQLIVKGNGYDKWIKRVLGFCKKAGVNPEKLGQEWAQTLTTEKYDTMDAQLYAFFKKHADKKGFTQGMDEVLAAFENEKSNTEWAAMIKKWFPNRKNQQ